MLKYIIPFIPNAITLTSMCLGLTALRLSYTREDIYCSLALLCIAAFLDGIDGKVARKLKAESPTGAQLDSLADFLNFCITPALIAFEWHLKDMYFFGWLTTLIFLAGGAYRLARFNVMYSKGVENITSNYFVGLPTPAGAILLFLPIVLQLVGFITTIPTFCVALYMIFISFLMVSHIKTPSNRLLCLKKETMPVVVFVGIGSVVGIIYAPLYVYLIGTGVYLSVTIFLFFKDDLYTKPKRVPPVK